MRVRGHRLAPGDAIGILAVRRGRQHASAGDNPVPETPENRPGATRLGLLGRRVGSNVRDMALAMQVANEPPPVVEVVIEIPRGSFLKRGSEGRIDFISPLPCPYNYGSVRQYIGGEGDYLDALVLGPRLPVGSKVVACAYGAIGLSERSMYDDKLVCAYAPLTESERQRVLRFFRFYARCKGLLNLLRGQGGHARCEGWGGATEAISRAVPAREVQRAPKVGF